MTKKITSGMTGMLTRQLVRLMSSFVLGMYGPIMDFQLETSYRCRMAHFYWSILILMGQLEDAIWTKQRPPCGTLWLAKLFVFRPIGLGAIELGTYLLQLLSLTNSYAHVSYPYRTRLLFKVSLGAFLGEGLGGGPYPLLS